MKFIQLILLGAALLTLESVAYAQQYMRGAQRPRYFPPARPITVTTNRESAEAVEQAATGPSQAPVARNQRSRAAMPAQTGYGTGGNGGNGGYGGGGGGGAVLVPRVSMAQTGTSIGTGGAEAGNVQGLGTGNGGVSYVTTPTPRLRSQIIARQFFSAGGIRFNNANTAVGGYVP